MFKLLQLTNSCQNLAAAAPSLLQILLTHSGGIVLSSETSRWPDLSPGKWIYTPCSLGLCLTLVQKSESMVTELNWEPPFIIRYIKSIKRYPILKTGQTFLSSCTPPCLSVPSVRALTFLVAPTKMLPLHLCLQTALITFQVNSLLLSNPFRCPSWTQHPLKPFTKIL